MLGGSATPTALFARIEGGIGDVPHDGQQPGSRIIASKGVKSAERADIRILDRVLGVISALQYPVRQVVRIVRCASTNCSKRDRDTMGGPLPHWFHRPAFGTIIRLVKAT
jgi:hypothetical protein